ncbi:hypothetical protein [Mesorhizobium sangaii]|uniref:Uncharacterized protein n=1 Tax=Mesorhizobium sangaii TaxID=505389 RepID=A0A841P6B0_9HYPH|nr:hypothetical protein [Mesorhizobium sangaii]MBB6408863.1 hypothetical protein [Mesorhizobium sangaii]
MGRLSIQPAGADLPPLLSMDRRHVSAQRYRDQYGHQARCSIPCGCIARALNAHGGGRRGTKGGFEWSHQTAELIVTMLLEIQSRGVATVAEVDIETLGQRMQREIEAGSVIVSRSEVGAWSHASN